MRPPRSGFRPSTTTPRYGCDLADTCTIGLPCSMDHAMLCPGERLVARVVAAWVVVITIVCELKNKASVAQHVAPAE